MKSFFTVLVLIGLSFTGSAYAAINPDTAPDGLSFYDRNANGEFIISALNKDTWKEVGRIKMDRYYRQQELSIDLPSSKSKSVKLRIKKTGGGAAQIDSVFLNGKAPVKANSTLQKINKRDLDVTNIELQALEVTFEGVSGNLPLSIAGRIEPVVISKAPFLYPLSNLFTKMTETSDFYTYRLNSNGSDPFFKAFSKCGSGHPDGYTYGWVTNDKKNLNIKIDFTPDNTIDGGKDYTAVFVKTDNGLKTFKVSENEKKWGTPQFTYSDKVPYQHKVYSFDIPLSEIGITDSSPDKEIQLAFAAYGTALPAATFDDSEGITYAVSSFRGNLEYITKTGDLETAVYFGAYSLLIDDNYYNGSYSAAEDNGRELAFNPASLSGLSVSRKVFVPENSNFVRYLDILENQTAGDITVDVKIDLSVASGANTVVHGTSDGDTTLEASDTWLATNGSATRLALATIWDGPYGSDSIDSANITSNSDIDWTWASLTVPAGETAILMYFGVPQVDGAAAAQRADVLANLSDANMLSGMSSAEITAVVNWPLVDDDGIDDAEEDGGPNQGDGNNDGIPDKFQKNVTTLQTHDDSAYVTIEAPAGMALVNCSNVSVSTLGDAPSHIVFEHGAFGFSVTGTAAGGSADVTITLPAGASPEKYFMYGRTSTNNTDHWYEFDYDGETGAEISGNVITLHFVDGKRGDSDLIENGQITDPGSPCSLDTSDSSGCFIGRLK